MNELLSAVDQYLDHLRQRGSGPRHVQVNRNQLRRFSRWVIQSQQTTRLADLTPRVFAAWRDYCFALRNSRTGQPLRPISVHSIQVTVRAYARWLVRTGRSPMSIERDYPEYRKPPLLYRSALPHAQVRQKLRAIPAEDAGRLALRALGELLYSTGARPCEVVRMDVGDVDFENAQVRLWGKGDKERMVPVGRHALRWLETYLRGIRPLLLRTPDEPAFWLNRRGGRMNYWNFYHHWRKLTRTVPALAGVTAYSFRRACATELARSGADIWAVKELLGHESLDHLIHYVRLELADLKKMHAKFHPRDREMNDDVRL